MHTFNGVKMMTRRDDESIASTIRREEGLRECKRALWVALKQVSGFRELSDTEVEMFYQVTNDKQIQELFKEVDKLFKRST